MIRIVQPLIEPKIVIEEINDPEYCAKADEQHLQTMRNCKWLSSHWPDLLPQARGRFVAVAGQQAFIADTWQAAWAAAKAAHPDDDGAIMQYVRKHTHPRIYANQWILVRRR